MLVKTSAISMLIATAATIGTALSGWALPLSPGDRVRIQTPADDELPQDSSFRFSGVYEVNLDGTIQVPFIEPLRAAGLEPDQVEREISTALLSKGFFRPEGFQLSARVAQWAPIQVTVEGETFRPGRVLINAAFDRDENPIPQRGQPASVSGEYPPERYLSAAIRNAGGLKPTADIRNIRLIRNQRESVIDMSGIITGQSVPDVPLIAGDQIVIPKLAIAQSELARPSQLTPTEIPIIISNQTAPSARGAELVNVEYGTRFSQAVVRAACAGGTRAVNARRRAALVQTNRLTGQTTVLERPVEVLLKKSGSEAENPLLMPQDAIVCYDSKVTGISGVLRLVSDIFRPFFLIQDLIGGND